MSDGRAYLKEKGIYNLRALPIVELIIFDKILYTPLSTSKSLPSIAFINHKWLFSFIWKQNSKQAVITRSLIEHYHFKDTSSPYIFKRIY